MKKALTFLAVLIATLGVAVALAAPAAAGSNNGTTNWYSSDSVTVSGGNLAVTNYDITVSGSKWQEYHVDADRAGGTGTAPKVYMRDVGTSTWTLLPYWNDFFIKQSNEWRMSDFKVVFANGSVGYIWAL